MAEPEQTLYAGLSHVTYGGEPFDLGHGVRLRATYAYLFGAHMMSFARAEPHQPHPAPWRAARGGFGYDIEGEIAVPIAGDLPGELTAEDTIWLLAALLRLAHHPYLSVPILSDHAFDAAATAKQEPLLRPFEIEPRILRAGDAEVAAIKTISLEWLRSVWPRTAELLKKHPSLNMALRAADATTVRGRPASALLTAWGAIEELFAPSRTELRFRVSAHIAAFLEPIGAKRLEVFKKVVSLYDARSKAAHSAQDAEVNSLVQSYILLRNALIQIIDKGEVPTQADFEKLLFCGDAPG